MEQFASDGARLVVGAQAGRCFGPVTPERVEVARPQVRRHVQGRAEHGVVLIDRLRIIRYKRAENTLVQVDRSVVERRRNPQLQPGIDSVVPFSPNRGVRRVDKSRDPGQFCRRPVDDDVHEGECVAQAP